MAIEIYNKYTKYNDALLNNGLYALDNITIKAETTEDIYGNYELNIELELLNNVPTSLYELIEVDNIIKVNDEGSEELFRIAQVEKGLETIELHCRHITISDSLNLWLNNVKPTNLNGMGALQWLAQRTEPKCNIIFSSNLANTSTADYVKMSLYDALFTSDNAFIKRWGGEVKRTGYTVRIDDRIGIDKTGTIKIKEALNLTNFNAKTNIDEVITVIHPVGAEGLSADRVVSDMVNNYSMEFPRKIEYKDVKVKKVNEQGEVTQEGFETEELAKAELIRLAKEEFTKNHIDQLQFTCDIDYLDLNKFEEYKDLAQIQTANLGDFISVRVDTFDMDIKARIVNRVYDVLRGRRIENTISTDGKLKKPVDINKIIEDLADKIEGQGFEDLSGYIDSMIQQGFKNGYLIYDKNACYAVDTLPKEKAKNVVVLNRNGLGYSSTGIAGPYKYGFTIDGKLNADMITTGALSGQYIKGGTIEANKLTVQAKQSIAEGFASTDAFINLDASVTGLSSTVGAIKETVNSQNTKISNIEQKADKIKLNVIETMSKGNKVNGGLFKGKGTPNPWDMTPGASWGVNNGHSGFRPNTTGNGDYHIISERISTGVTGNIISISARIQAEYNTKGAELFIIGSRTSTPAQHWSVGPMVFSTNSDYVTKSDNNLSIPSDIKYLWVKIFHKGSKGSTSNYVYIDWVNLTSGDRAFDLYGLPFGGVNSSISNIELKSNEIELSVKEKVNEDEIISSINLSPESIKINAKKLELNGLVKFANLTDGKTTISGDNIQTGTINAIDITGSNINGAYIAGTKSLYMAKGGTMSCDGNTYIRNLYVPETHPGWQGAVGSFAVGPSAFFDNSVHVGQKKGELWIGNQGVVKRSRSAWIQVDKLAIQNGSSAYLEIAGYNSNHVYGVDLWYSDQALKENIVELENSTPKPLATKKIGLNLINSIKHYQFDYKTKKTTEEGQEETTTTPVACGYISQNLNEHNDQLTQAITQGDGSTLLSPRPSFIIPNITLAIQEQQKTIEELTQRIAQLEAKLVNK